nr:hypothetical protein [Bacteroidota bacterium]
DAGNALATKGCFWPKVVYGKLFLLHPEMRQWEKIIYLDTDVLVRKDINALTNYPCFAARKETMGHNLLYQFLPDLEYCSTYHKNELGKLQQKYDFKETSFNVGVMVIPTHQNTEKNFMEVVKLANELYGFAYFPEQAVLNLFFYKKWSNIPYIYNDVYAHDTFNQKGYWGRSSDQDAVILHCVGSPKPWEPTSQYFAEWNRNLQDAEMLFNIEQVGTAPTQKSIDKVERINAMNSNLGKWNRFLWKCKRLALILMNKQSVVK